MGNTAGPVNPTTLSQSSTEFWETLKKHVRDAVLDVVHKTAEGHNYALSEREAASWLKVKPQTLAVWRHEGRGPTYRKHGSRVVYFLNDLLEYSEDNRVRRT